MKYKIGVVVPLFIGIFLSGCQSNEQSLNSAYNTCSRTGLRPGTFEYQSCTQSLYEENRRKSDQAAAAIAVGVAAGALGAVAISEANKKDKRDKDYRRKNYRPYNSPSHIRNRNDNIYPARNTNSYGF